MQASPATEPGLWAAGVDTVGVANFVTLGENTEDNRRSLREAEFGSLATDREFLESTSLNSMVDRTIPPFRVLHGANDPRVPLREANRSQDGPGIQCGMSISWCSMTTDTASPSSSTGELLIGGSLTSLTIVSPMRT